jgi:FkbM family methyltransferase
MLIKFSNIVQKYQKPKGIIHIGAHLREEKIDYILNGVTNLLWVEGNKKIYEQSLKKGLLEQELFFNEVITDCDNDTLQFNITNNGQSSSVLNLDKHKIYYPNIYVTETIKVKTKRFDTLVSENNINITNYNFLNLDIQGAELLALKSFGNLLNNIDYVYTEVNKAKLYENCALIEEIDAYLTDFKRVETVITEAEWGDALYIRN